MYVLFLVKDKPEASDSLGCYQGQHITVLQRPSRLVHARPQLLITNKSFVNTSAVSSAS